MKRIQIQFQPDLCIPERASQLLRWLEQTASNDELIHQAYYEAGEDKGRYINFYIDTSRPVELWRFIQSTLHLKTHRRSPRKTPLIITCEGEHGWHDYLLLYHYHKRIRLDKLAQHKE